MRSPIEVFRFWTTVCVDIEAFFDSGTIRGPMSLDRAVLSGDKRLGSGPRHARRGCVQLPEVL